MNHKYIDVHRGKFFDVHNRTLIMVAETPNFDIVIEIFLEYSTKGIFEGYYINRIYDEEIIYHGIDMEYNYAILLTPF